MKRVVIIGAGGCARDVRWILEEMARAGADLSFGGFIVSDLSKLGPHDSRSEVLGDFSWLEANGESFDGIALGIGTPAPRLRVARQLEANYGPERFTVIRHPSALIDDSSAEISHGVVVGARVTGTVNLSIAPFAIFGSLCTLGHEAKLGRACVLNPSVNISGGVTVGEGVLIGTGAQVLQYLTVGEGATVGAGAVVTKDVMPGSTVVGVPAKQLQRADTG